VCADEQVCHAFMSENSNRGYHDLAIEVIKQKATKYIDKN